MAARTGRSKTMPLSSQLGKHINYFKGINVSNRPAVTAVLSID